MTELELQDIVDSVRETKHPRAVRLTYTTDPGLKSGHPFKGIVKRSTITGRIGDDYEKLVNEALAKEGGTGDFKAGKRAWGTRIGTTPLIRHTPKGQSVEKLYVEVFVETTGSRYEMNGVEIMFDELVLFLKERPARTGPVDVRTISFDNIESFEFIAPKGWESVETSVEDAPAQLTG